MTNLFDKVKAMCALVVLGIGSAAYSAAPTVTSVTAQQRYPWNGLVDIAVTFNGEQGDVAKANCTFAATNGATKTALAIAHVTPQGSDTGSGTTWTRRFIWDTNADLGEVKIDDAELFADVEVVEEPDGSGGVQLWEGGPYWAECNVGASKPEECGYYCWWGDTVGHTGDWHFSTDHCPTYGKSEFELCSLGYVDSSGNIAPAHDAARAHWGSPWRMPTDAEFAALVSNCDTQWTTRNGVNGQLVKGRWAYSSKSIFLPAAAFGLTSHLYSLGSYGYYWSSTPYSGGSDGAWGLYFSSYNFGRCFNNRYFGLSVRPVRGFASSSHVAYSVHLSLDNRTGMRVAAATERICFSPAWDTDVAGATAVVSVNRAAVKSATEAGVFDWTPAQDGIYQLTHAVYVNGEQVGETLTATFKVGNVIADENFEYTLIGSEYAEVKRYIGSQTGEVVIPDVVMLNAFGMVTKDLGLSVESRKVIGIGEDAFRTATMQYVKIPEGMRDIGRYAFYGCDNLRSIVIPNTVEWIGECAFASCLSLTEATIDGKALSLSTRCFAEDGALQEVHIGDGVLDLPRSENATFASGAFYNCNSLRKVTIGSGIYEFPAYAFYGLSELSKLSVAGRVKWIGDEAFRGCASLEQLDGDVRPVEIGLHAFVGSEIQGLDFSACEIVGKGAFDGCANFLGEIRNGSGGYLDLPAIKSVQAEAFRGSVSLTTLRFGSSLVYLGYEAFLNSGVKNVFFAGPHPATSGVDSFGNGTDTPPAGAYYSDWSDWASVIDPDTLTWNGLRFIPTENYRRVIECSFVAQQGEPQSEFDVKKAVAVLYKEVNGYYVEIDRSCRHPQAFRVEKGTYRIEFQYADDTWVAANYSTVLTISDEPPGWAIKETGRYMKATDTWSLWVQLYANEGDDLPYAERYYRGDACDWIETAAIAIDPNIKIPLSDLNWPLWALQNEEEIEWYEYDAIDRKSGPRMFVDRIAGRRCFEIWEKDVPDHVLRLVAKKKNGEKDCVDKVW